MQVAFNSTHQKTADARPWQYSMHFGVLVSSIIKAHGFPAGPRVLTVQTNRIVVVDFHLGDVLLYSELDPEHGYAYNANFFVNRNQRHKGIGARLVAAHEEICRETELTILINNNRNPPFWKRHGYRRLNPFRQIQLARRLGISFDSNSVYKSF